MPQSTFQKLVFMFLTVLFSVSSFVIYNIALSLGGMSNKVFLLALHEIPIEFIFAFSFELLFVYKLSERISFSIINPQEEKPYIIILVITGVTISLMCPLMSFVATILYDGINAQFFANWLQKIVFNFPFAFFIQIFAIRPMVRTIFKTLFFRQIPQEV